MIFHLQIDFFKINTVVYLPLLLRLHSSKMWALKKLHFIVNTPDWYSFISFRMDIWNCTNLTGSIILNWDAYRIVVVERVSTRCKVMQPLINLLIVNIFCFIFVENI